MAGHKAVHSQEEVHQNSPMLMGIAAILLFGMLAVCILITGYKVMLTRLQHTVERQKFPSMKDDSNSDAESILAEGQWRPSARKPRHSSLRKPALSHFRNACKANDELPEESQALTSNHDYASRVHILGDDPVHDVPESSKSLGDSRPSNRPASSRQASSRQASSRQVSTRHSAAEPFRDNKSERRAEKLQPESQAHGSQQEEAQPAPNLTGPSIDMD